MTGARITLYASGRDEALLLSREFHHDLRTGDTLQGFFLAPGIDTIDASAVDTELGWGEWGHSYATRQRSVLGDIGQLVANNTPPDQRFGILPEPPGKKPPEHWRVSR